MKTLLIFLGLAGAALAQAPAQVGIATLRPGDAIPEIRGVTMDGKPFHLGTDLKGKVVLLDFWATWCGPCVAETPNILKNHQRWHAKGFEVVAISLDEKPAAAASYVKSKNLPWIQLCDGMGFRSPLARAFGITAIPQLVLLDRDGRVAHPHALGATLDEELERLLGKAAASSPTAPSKAFGKLVTLLDEGPDDAAAKTVAELLATGSLTRADIDNLLIRHANRLAPPATPWALYLLADDSLSQGSTPVDEWQRAKVMSARCALELGGPYAAEELIGARAGSQAPSPEFQALLVHHALKTGKSRDAVRVLHGMTMDGRALYQDVHAAMMMLKNADAGESACLTRELEMWLKSQQNLPPDRMRAISRDGRLRISYRPEGTCMNGCLAMKLMLAPDRASFFVVPMKCEGGEFVADIDPPAPGKTVRWYVTDGRSRSDTNEGRCWSVP